MDYNPPYESPIEQYLLTKLQGHLSHDVALSLQVPFATKCGAFRVDSVLTQDAKRVGIECDGKEFHDFNRDEWRDAILLGEGHVTSIVRFSGASIIGCPLGCLAAFGYWFPSMLSERGLALAEKTQKELGGDDVFCDECIVSCRYLDIDGERREFRADRRGTGGREFWQVYYQYACDHGGDLDELIKRFKNSDRSSARIVNGK